MNMSPRRARAASPARTGAAVPQRVVVQPEVLPFPYNEAAGTTGRRDFPQTGAGKGESEAATVLAAQGMEREARARELGRQQGESESRTKFEERLAGERSAVARALTDFAGERAAYYQKIEEEAVRLALSIARKILHRESHVDPLLLMGMVRVALERIEGASGVVLAVHPEQAAVWRNYLATSMGTSMGAKAMPEIAEDAALAPDECELRTSMGTAQLGVEEQLKEIEQGLMDLLAARPQGQAERKEKP